MHFTILRPPDKQDSTPINELALIQFPTRELFAEKLSEFDLVILDRYQNRDILPLAYFDNLARYVENGGALLLSSGPEFADESSIYRTPLAAVLPAQPTGEVITQPFRPMITRAGFAHPVTRDLPLVNDALQAVSAPDNGANAGPAGATPAPLPPGSEELPAQPNWGRWFRLIAAQRLSGNTVMSGPGDRPLLVLDRVQKGRVAQLLSDQIWLWARGYENGGPQAELLRRLAHWLMKEPELEEERLTAEVAGGELRVTRQTMADRAPDVSVTTPTGKTEVVHMSPSSPGRFVGHLKAEELGALSDERRYPECRRRGGTIKPARSCRHACDGCDLAPVRGCDRWRRAVALGRPSRTSRPSTVGVDNARQRLVRYRASRRLSRHFGGQRGTAATVACADHRV